MIALQTLRTMREATAKDLAKAANMPLEDVYQVLVAAQTQGAVSLRQTFKRGRKAVFSWVAL